MKTLVLGIGNTLFRDEGAGVHAVERLHAAYEFPEDVRVLDGGTLGMDLLVHFEGNDQLILIDAVEMDQPPGTLVRLEDEELQTTISLKLSPHQAGLAELLALAQLQHILPKKTALFGIQPQQLELGTDLSPVVSEALESLVAQVIRELEQAGYRLRKID